MTPEGAVFLKAHPLLQVGTMLVVWWKDVDWLIALPRSGMGERLPRGFQKTTLSHLSSLPVETRPPFESLADRLIQKGRLSWLSGDKSYHRMLLHGAVERMVIRVLADFGVVEPEYEDVRLGKGTMQKLVAFQLTSFGWGLLQAVA